LARIRTILRRSRLAARAQVEFPAGETEGAAALLAQRHLGERTRRLQAPDGHLVELSNQEFNLLVAFCGAPQRVLSRDQLLGLSRLNNAEVYDRTVDVQVLRLRRKIEADAFHPKLIVTERGAGYRFDSVVQTLV
ncbi:DNA-binding response regulator, partial [Rubrivivax gelatinosus]|nr:DNA-binding response regulator [Rubrivivax gelatinosus]